MPEQVTGQSNPGTFSPSDTGQQTAVPVAQTPAGTGKPARTSGNLLKAAKRKTTMTYLLDELRQQSKPIPDTFESVDRRLPAPPAPAILQRALGSCYSQFLDFSELAKAVHESRELLLEAICGLADENQRLANAAAMSAFESRLFSSNSDKALNEIIKTYEQLARLLQDEPTERSLPWQCRLLATSHFLDHAAKPETLCQGSKIGSQTLCLTQKLATNNPSRLAEMLASAGIYGSWLAFDGKTVIIDEHSMKPGAEEILYRPGDNLRSYAAKILQCLLLNNCLRRRSKPMTYSETPGRPGRDYGGQIVRTIEGEPVNPKLGANLSFTELGLLARFEFGQPACVIVNDASFSRQSAEYADQLSQQNILVHINSVSDLSDVLLKAKDNDSIPVMIAVDERRLLAESYRDGINHCINVVTYNEYGLLKIFNPQLLPGMPRLTRTNLQRLYNATLGTAKA